MNAFRVCKDSGFRAESVKMFPLILCELFKMRRGNTRFFYNQGWHYPTYILVIGTLPMAIDLDRRYFARFKNPLVLFFGFIALCCEVSFLLRTLEMTLLLLYLFHFVDTLLFFPGSAFQFIQVYFTDISFTKYFCLLHGG